MKSILLIGVFLISNSLYSQTLQSRSDVETPNGSNVEAWILSEFSSEEIYNLTVYWQRQYPNAVKKANASLKYNCHGYAWHMTEGGDSRWIDYPNNFIYINDGSYMEVPYTNVANLKVVYNSDDHSAVTAGTQNVFISKWGRGPLMEHQYNYCPYDSNSLKYYVKSSNVYILGTDVMPNNGEEIFYLKYNPEGTFNWTVNGPLQILSGQGTNTVRVKAVGTGNATLSVSNNNGFSKIKQIRIGVPEADKINVVLGMDNTLYSMHTDRNECRASYSGSGEILEYEWESADWSVFVSNDEKKSYVLLKANHYPVSTMSNIKVRARNSAGWSNYRLFGCNVNNEWTTYSLLSDGYGIITLKNNESNMLNVMKDVDTQINYKLFGQNSGLELCSGAISSNGGTLDFSSYSSGLYVLYIYDVTGSKFKSFKFTIK